MVRSIVSGATHPSVMALFVCKDVQSNRKREQKTSIYYLQNVESWQSKIDKLRLYDHNFIADQPGQTRLKKESPMLNKFSKCCYKWNHLNSGGRRQMDVNTLHTFSQEIRFNLPASLKKISLLSFLP